MAFHVDAFIYTGHCNKLTLRFRDAQIDSDGRFFFCLDDFEPNRLPVKLPNIDFTVIDLRLLFSWYLSLPFRLASLELLLPQLFALKLAFR